MITSPTDRHRALALRAFPPRWRDRHGEELLHVSGELASSTGDSPSWHELVDIVRGGLTVRIEDRPPLRVRVAYRWLEKPVPARWHPWMRDELRGRFLGYRRNLRTMFPIWLVVAIDAVLGGTNRALLMSQALVLLAIFIASSRFQAKRVRKRMNAKVGYDIVASDALAPPTLFTPPVLRRPAARMPFLHYGVPFAAWSLLSGAALVAGAAISNSPKRSIGPVTFTPDPNSPLTTQQVSTVGLGIAMGAAALTVVTGLVVGRRVQSLVAATIHESVPLRPRNAWLGATCIGAPATLVGALGVMPDLASVAIGSMLVLAGAASGVTALFVARRGAEIGRHISLAEILVGERDPATPGLHQPADTGDR